METTVVNIYHKVPYDVYIGRAGKGQDGYFGNPCNIGSREDKIEAFRKYFHKRLKSDIEFAFKVRHLKGKRLGCFCSPKSCHGDIIAQYVNNLPDIKPIKMAVIGSRSFMSYNFLESILRWYDISKIISGGAKGADRLAASYAQDLGIPLQEFIPEWDKYGRSAGYRRNQLIIDAADEVIAFWDGTSKGTGHSVSIAEEQGKPVYIYWPEPNSTEDEIANLGL